MPSHWSLGKGSQGNPIRPIKDYSGLLGIARAHCEDLVPHSLGSNGLYDTQVGILASEDRPSKPHAVEARKLEHDRPLIPDERKKEDQHESCYIHVPTFGSLLVRILHSGSKAQHRGGIPETMVCRILMFLWLSRPLNQDLPPVRGWNL